MAQTLGGWPVPSCYNAMRVTASGRKGATRWEITRASTPMDEDGWIGDIVHFMPEDVWSSQPSLSDAFDETDYKQPQDAFAALVRAMCIEAATYLVTYRGVHEDDRESTRVCRTHLADSVDAHWKFMWDMVKAKKMSLTDLIVIPMATSSNLFCERDDLN